MPDVNLNVRFPNQITTEVISPTFEGIANVNIAGPQGPVGPQGPSGQVNISELNTIYVTKTSGQFNDRPNVNGTGILLSGEAAALPNTIVYITGNQVISGIKTFIDNLEVQGTGIFNAIDLSNIGEFSFSGTTLNLTDSNVYISGGNIYISGNPVLTGVNLNPYATTNNLFLTGSTLDNKINAFSGTYQNFVDNLDNSYATDIQLQNTGSTLLGNINSLSGVLTNDYYLKSNPSGFITGVDLSNYYTKDNPSGFITGVDLSSYATIINLELTGIEFNNKINSLSGDAILKYDDQIIYGNKTFNDAVYIHDLYVTGDRFIVNTIDTLVESNYLLLNLTGGAVDGGIFFVTGSGLTGLNDTGPIIGFDHTDKFKFGISTRASDLSSLNDIAAVQDIIAYSGFVNNKYATIINLASTGSTLATNLASTGSALQNNINTLTTNLINTGSNLSNQINSMSGAFNLSGSNLDNKITSLSGAAVLIYGNQTISGNKTFVNTIQFTGSQTGTFFEILDGDIEIQGSNVTISGGNVILYSRPTVNGTGVLLIGEVAALPTTIVYTTGAQTISGNKTFATRPTVNGTGILLSGEAAALPTTIVYTTGNQTIGGIKTFTDTGIFGSMEVSVDEINISGVNLILTNGTGVFENILLNGNPVLTGVDLSNYYTKDNPSGFITGVDLSNYVTRTNGEFNNRPTVNGTGILLSGDLNNQLDILGVNSIVYAISLG